MVEVRSGSRLRRTGLEHGHACLVGVARSDTEALVVVLSSSECTKGSGMIRTRRVGGALTATEIVSGGVRTSFIQDNNNRWVGNPEIQVASKEAWNVD